MECRESSTVNGVENARWMRCKIKVTDGTVYGVILFPDVFVWPTVDGAPLETTAVFVNAKECLYSKAPEYTIAQFNTLESAGAVFLPSAGYRHGSGIYTSTSDEEIPRKAYYWTSTVSDDPNYSPDKYSYAFTCWEKYGFGQASMGRFEGCFVRLVTEAK